MKWFLMLASMKYIATQQLPTVWSFCVMVLSHLPWFRGQLPQQRNNGHVMLTSVNYQLTVTNTRQLNKKNNPKLFPPKLPCCSRSKELQVTKYCPVVRSMNSNISFSFKLHKMLNISIRSTHRTLTYIPLLLKVQMIATHITYTHSLVWFCTFTLCWILPESIHI